MEFACLDPARVGAGISSPRSRAAAPSAPAPSASSSGSPG